MKRRLCSASSPEAEDVGGRPALLLGPHRHAGLLCELPECGVGEAGVGGLDAPARRHPHTGERPHVRSPTRQQHLEKMATLIEMLLAANLL